VGDGGWMMDSAEEVVEGFESRPPALWSLAHYRQVVIMARWRKDELVE